MPYNSEFLRQIFHEGEKNLNKLQKMGRNSCHSRGLPFYGALGQRFPVHLMSFKGMHKRSKNFGKAIEFPRDLEGFIDFICHIGPIPIGMKRPTVGRKDHSLGYVRGNFFWQENHDNCSEVARRVHRLDRYSGYRRTRSIRKRQNLINFVKSNKGIFSLEEILEKTGRIDPVKLVFFLRTCSNCRLMVKGFRGYVEIK